MSEALSSARVAARERSSSVLALTSGRSDILMALDDAPLGE